MAQVSLNEIFAQTLRDHLQPVSQALADPKVSDILVNGASEVYVERAGRLHQTQLRFPDEAALDSAVRNIAQFVGKSISAEQPLLDARLPDGARVTVIMPPVARQGIYLAIRKFQREVMNIEKLVQLQTLSEETAEFLGVCVASSRNLLVTGGTGSGKTSLLNVLSTRIPLDQRILVLEDSSELQLQQPHVITLETRPPDRDGRGEVSMRDLLRTSLRMRPDRIVIGEVRGPEALDLVQAMTSGHRGSMSTTHANNPHDALARIETLCMMSDVQLPLHALRSQISSSIDLLVQIQRFPDGTRKVTHVSEVLTLTKDNSYQVTDIYRYRVVARGKDGPIGRLECRGVPAFAEDIRLQGIALPKAMADMAEAARRKEDLKK